MSKKEPLITIEKEAAQVYQNHFLVPNDRDKERLRKMFVNDKSKKLIITVTEKEA